ncbi:phage tail protein, partial [Paenibacillus polymyxa]
FAVFRGKKNIGESELTYQGQGDIIIAPVIIGSKRAGVLQTVVGALLIAASFFTFWAPPVSAGLFASGVGMVAGGVIQMLSPQAGGLKTSSAPENTPGYAFGSARNTTASGNPVPLCCGHRRWGGAIISAAIYAEDRV